MVKKSQMTKRGMQRVNAMAQMDMHIDLFDANTNEWLMALDDVDMTMYPLSKAYDAFNAELSKHLNYAEIRQTLGIPYNDMVEESVKKSAPALKQSFSDMVAKQRAKNYQDPKLLTKSLEDFLYDQLPPSIDTAIGKLIVNVSSYGGKNGQPHAWYSFEEHPYYVEIQVEPTSDDGESGTIRFEMTYQGGNRQVGNSFPYNGVNDIVSQIQNNFENEVNMLKQYYGENKSARKTRKG